MISQILVEINFPENLKFSRVASSHWSFMKTNIRRGETSCLFELDIRPGTAERAVESTSTLDLEQRKEL